MPTPVELGVMRLGSRPKARIRFDRDAREALEARQRRATTKRKK